MDKKIGYVTFADILGWKGIWRNGNYSCLEKIIKIKERLEKKKNTIKYLEALEILKEIEKLSKEDEKTINYQLLKDKLLREEEVDENITKIIDEYFNKIYEILKEKFKTSTPKEEVQEELKNFFYDKKNNLINVELEKQINQYGIEKIAQEPKDLKTIREMIREVSKAIKMKDVYIKIDLISDTFVITSERKGEDSNERSIHLEVCKELILECLNEGLLVRGATAYGEYYNKATVYVGPAIDESASWHEQGDEIGIFLTKSAELKDASLIENTLIKHTVNVKKGKLEDALVIDWSKGEEKFYDKFRKESPFLPEIALKYINSQKFLDKQKIEKISKID